MQKAIITSYPHAWCPCLTPGQLLHANTCSFLNQPKVIFLVPLTGALGTERDTAVLLIASCWPSSILCRVSTASLQCIFHYFPSSFTTYYSKRADACLPPSCSCSSMSPCSRHHSSSCVLPHPLWQSPSTARTAALHGTKSTEPLGSLTLRPSSLWEVWPQPQHRVFGAELEEEHSYFKSKCSVTAQWPLFLSSSKETGQTCSFGLTLGLLWRHCYASDTSKAEVWQ